MTIRYDIVFIADARFEGGSSTALAAEIRAAARGGLTTGLLMVKGPILGLPLPVHAEIRAAIDQGLVRRVDPDQKTKCTLAILHHPSIVENYLQPRPRLKGDKAIMVLHHPVTDRAGKKQYDLAAVVRHLTAAFDLHAHLAPVSPVVRASMPAILPENSSVLADDWHNIIDLEEWPARAIRTPSFPVKIGRHSRPHPQKWPDLFSVAKRVYPPDATKYSIVMLGGGDFLEEMYGILPANWHIIPFSFSGVRAFLEDLDFYVYFHSDGWSEAFGRTILEALAVGLVVILPAHFRALFGDAAVYSSPLNVKNTIAAHVADPERCARQCRMARAFVEERHSATTFAARIAALAGDASTPSGAHPAKQAHLPVRPVLFISSNGIGMGHLTRQMAIADRLTPDLTAVFATMSYAIRMAIDAGYQAHYINHHRSLDADIDDWNTVLADELFDIIAHLRPAVIAYDATAVFPGVIDALSMFPDIYSLWIRRPMWRETHRMFLQHADTFDAVIEPGELAQDLDYGPTGELRSKTFLVPPVLHMAPSQRVDRKTARDRLDLPGDGVMVSLQLGSGNNYPMNDVRTAIIDAVLSRPGTMLVEFRSPLRRKSETDMPTHPRHVIREIFPAFRYSTAFDAAVSAAGYNAFHENILGCIPTLFVPNEADEMDLQFNRALWATLHGCGMLMRRDADLAQADALIERLLDPETNAEIVRRCRSINWRNGADDIADFIEDHARLCRSDRKPGQRL